MEGVQNHKAVLHVKNCFSISNMSGDRGKYSRAKGTYLIVHQLRTHSQLQWCDIVEQSTERASASQIARNL